MLARKLLTPRFNKGLQSARAVFAPGMRQLPPLPLPSLVPGGDRQQGGGGGPSTMLLMGGGSSANEGSRKGSGGGGGDQEGFLELPEMTRLLVVAGESTGPG